MKWVNVFGDKTYIDYFAGMAKYGNMIYVLTTSFSTKFSQDATNRDINYYRVRKENGYVAYRETLGSPGDDVAYDI